ncbi:ABC transporter substrate-binding protein [Arvimicrobium flavum]|uniref:ABC transporter substrate-binding protein n=1 Tax=Arvimicrobium flavum TaxID=3393320 RepID=UPI00237BDCA3|nr:ABC transporter substrate-binding protein [Mesorhizobium shangrilense]
MNRFIKGLAASAVALWVAQVGFAGSAAAEGNKSLTAVLEAEIVTLDPHFTTAYITRTFGYMVYDTLFAMDGAGNIKPQMVDTWTVSDDNLTWSFKLRDGLKWHDGAPVTSEDVVASIKRWWEVAALGVQLRNATDAITADSATEFTIKLKEPFGLITTALGHPNAPVAFMMPKRLAETPANVQLQEVVGSGPFVYDRERHRQGDTMVLKRNDSYVPRSEPADFMAGAKVVNIDELVIKTLPDAVTAATALTAGEIDYVQYPPFDLLPVLEGDPNIKVLSFTGVNMYQGYFRLNHRLAPFDDPEIRRVLWSVVDQNSVPAALGLSGQYTVPDCKSFFLCGTPYETTAGSISPEAPSVELAKEALAKTKYNGEKIVILQATDIDATRVSSAVAADWLRQVGFNVELQAMDWASVLSTRANPEAWHLFGVHATGLDLSLPNTHFYTARNCVDYAGWHCDEKMGEYLAAFPRATSEEERKQLADRISERAYEITPAVMWGQIAQPAAYRSGFEGIIPSSIPVFWNLERK